MPEERDPGTAPRAWHLAPLAALAVSHPIAEVLVHGPEFFVAHRFDDGALLWLAFWLFIGLPGGLWLLTAALCRLSRPAGQAITTGLFSILVALIAVQVLTRLGFGQTWFVLVLGAAAALILLAAYHLARAVRLFVSLLAPAPIVALGLFLASPPAVTLLRGPQAAAAVPSTAAATPVVLVVFDQLPLVSLLDGQGDLDAARFPSFAAFAADATWYRDTTTVSGSTTWAVPALVSGRYPEPDRLPSALDHPDTLFSLLAGSHRLHVVEPMTALCPAELCPPPEEDPQAPPRWVAVLADLVIVFGHILLPGDLAASLPPVTQEWGGFGRDFWQVRWAAERDDDRRRLALDWIERIDGVDQPALHFLHVLLPHEPYLYLPSGQRGGTSPVMPGLDRDAVRWSQDTELVALDYQRHLLQTQYVDTLLGRLMRRLKAAGLYERAIIAVVADHGASFQPGEGFKAPNEASWADVAAVPFFLKVPDRPGGRIVGDPLEIVDVLPTIAAALGIAVPWSLDGRAAEAGRRQEAARRMYIHRATQHFTFTTDELDAGLRRAAENRAALVDPDPARLDSPTDPARHLIGTPIDALPSAGDPSLQISLDGAPLFEDLDLDGDLMPVYVSGTARPLAEAPAAGARLALAVNGVIRATTAVADRQIAGREGFWAALVPVEAYRPGWNDIAVFHVASSRAPVRLRATRFTHRPGQPPNLMDPTVHALLEVDTEGFHGIEWLGTDSFRWTSGHASLSLPIDPGAPPQAVEIGVLMGGHPERTLEVRANDCLLYRDPIPAGPWEASLPLDDCTALGDRVTVRFVSDTFVPGEQDSRELGVAVESVRLVPRSGG